MIHDPQIEVTCDGEGCDSFVFIEPVYKYRDYSGRNGDYDCSDDSIEDSLAEERWIVEDGKHYCDKACAP